MMRFTKGGATIDLLSIPYQMLRELECYAAAEAIVERRRSSRDRGKARRAGGRGGRHR